MSDLRIPVAPRKRQVFVIDAEGIVPPDAPFLEEEARDFYCKMRPEGLIMVCGQPPGESHDAAVEWGYLDDALEPTLQRLPQLRHRRITGAWAGIRPISADGQPVLGAAPGLEGYVVAGGLGAQGVARGPLVGRLVAEMVTTGHASLDLSAYRPDRFARGRGR
jgi:glycine/D-amino acid oxidase-like deaminating enzyme